MVIRSSCEESAENTVSKGVFHNKIRECENIEILKKGTKLDYLRENECYEELYAGFGLFPQGIYWESNLTHELCEKCIYCNTTLKWCTCMLESRPVTTTFCFVILVRIRAIKFNSFQIGYIMCMWQELLNLNGRLDNVIYMFILQGLFVPLEHHPYHNFTLLTWIDYG